MKLILTFGMLKNVLKMSDFTNSFWFGISKDIYCCFFWRWFMLSIVLNCLAGRFLFPLMACSRPSYPSPFSSGDIAAPPSCVLVLVYSGFLVKVLTSRKAARWSCILFPLAKRWGEVRWGEVRWGEVRWGEVNWQYILVIQGNFCAFLI